MCFHFVCPPTRYLLPEYEAVHLLHSSSPPLLPFYRYVLLHRSPGNGLVASQIQSSNGRHRSNKSSIHRHLAVLHRVFQKIAVQFRQDRKLVAFRSEDIQLEINEVFFYRVGLSNLCRRTHSTVCILKFLHQLMVFHSAVSSGAVGRQILFQLKPVSIEFVVADRFKDIIVRQKKLCGEDVCPPFCLGVVQAVKVGVLKCLAGAGVLPVEESMSQLMSQSRYTLGICTIWG